MSQETVEENDCLLVVDDEGTIFMPVEQEDGTIALSECKLVLTKQEFEDCEVESMDDLKMVIKELNEEMDGVPEESEEEEPDSDEEQEGEDEELEEEE